MKLPTVTIQAESEMQMWREYLTFLNGLSNRPLTDRELDVMSYYLAVPLTVKNPLRGQSRKDLKKLFNIREQTLAMHIGNIKEKGWLSSEGKKYILPQVLDKARDQVKTTGDYSINVSINILYESRVSDKKNGRETWATGGAGENSSTGPVEKHQEDAVRSVG